MLVVLVVYVSMANQYRMNFLGQETQVLHAKTKKGKCLLCRRSSELNSLQNRKRSEKGCYLW